MYIAPLNKEKIGCNGQPGFLLIEIMIAFVIMTSMTLMIAHYQGRIAQWQRNTFHRLQAVDTLSSFLDEIVFLQTMPDSHNIQQGDFTITWVTKNYSMPVKNLSTKFAKQFRIIDAVISWPNASGKTESIKMNSGVYVK